MSARNLPDRAARGSMGMSLERAFDVLVAIVAILVLGPLMLVIALAVRLESPGPVFFCQTRIGRGGRRFGMYKFRKFHRNAGNSGSPLTLHKDPRLTRVGAALMATKLDELPQLWNVIRGDMAIVGPRPESLAFADCFQDGREELLRYKPGLLGPCQIMFRNETAALPSGGDADQFYREVLFPQKAQIDLRYFESRTFASDILIIVRGVLAVCGVVARVQVPRSELGAAPTAEAGARPAVL
jgi:lipopolysaccharide/colanic/teichoic acid biosynthesis glycosyltransferase